MVVWRRPRHTPSVLSAGVSVGISEFDSFVSSFFWCGLGMCTLGLSGVLRTKSMGFIGGDVFGDVLLVSCEKSTGLVEDAFFQGILYLSGEIRRCIAQSPCCWWEPVSF